MLDEEMILIVGKNKEHIRYVLKIFEKIMFVDVINLENLSEDVDIKINKGKNIYIMYKEDETEFQRLWPNIYAEKKPVCMNLTANMIEKYAQKSIRKSFNPFMKNKMTELMYEMFPESKSPDPSFYNRMCVRCNKRELIPIEVACKTAPVCEECMEKIMKR